MQCVLLLVKSISLTSRHDFDPFFGCPHLGEADLVDFEVLIYFLQCAFFSGVGHFDPEAPVYFLQWITLWHLDSGLIGFLFAGNTLTSFFFVLLAFTSLPHFEAGLFALEGGLIAAAIHVLAKKGLTA